MPCFVKNHCRGRDGFQVLHHHHTSGACPKVALWPQISSRFENRVRSILDINISTRILCKQVFTTSIQTTLI